MELWPRQVKLIVSMLATAASHVQVQEETKGSKKQKKKKKQKGRNKRVRTGGEVPGRPDDFGYGFYARVADFDADGEDEAMLNDRRFAWLYEMEIME